MALLARKTIGVGDKKKMVLDYNDWLDETETVTAVVLAVSAGPATLTSSIAGDGKTVTIFVQCASCVVATDNPFDVNITATSSTTQVKHDHVEMNVVTP